MKTFAEKMSLQYGDADIYAVVSKDNGENFSNMKILEDDPQGRLLLYRHPRNGRRLCVTWLFGRRHG